MDTFGPIPLHGKRHLRNVRFAFKLSTNERLALAKLADIEGGLSDAAILRRLIRQAAYDHGIWPIQDNPGLQGMVERRVLMDD